MIRAAAFALALLAPTLAAALEISPRPLARGDSIATVSATNTLRPQARRAVAIAPVTATLQRPVARPFERPELTRSARTKAQWRAEQNLFAFSPTAPAISLPPVGRSPTFVKAMQDRQAALLRGQVCSDPAIQGDRLGDVPGRGRCGIENAVQVRSVAGVQLTPPARMDCRTAGALKDWVTDGLQPATQGQAAALRVIGSYSCRFRNAAASGKLSEHAFGRAIDISGVKLKDGREMTLLTGWNTAQDRAAWRQMWRAACGPFGTVLGPESNRFHRDHFHFDTARYRSGPYCR